ncbi:testis-expressed basic protein 1 [Sturnira hondurensis]|uniref:testis-expressed basic protein 1 n=1 Tax=Sturnira hondurensis TaxID=192404 RepID=UPI00187A7AAB|nr:testis-expressed basic protein 1 [Sturnira hondurensis]
MSLSISADTSGKITLSPMVIFPGYMDGELAKKSDPRALILKHGGTSKSKSSQEENKGALKKEILFTNSDKSLMCEAKGIELKKYKMGMEAKVQESDMEMPKRQEAQVEESESKIPQGQEPQGKDSEAGIPQGQESQVEESESKIPPGQEPQGKDSEAGIPQGQESQVKNKNSEDKGNQDEEKGDTGENEDVKEKEAKKKKGGGEKVKAKGKKEPQANGKRAEALKEGPSREKKEDLYNVNL